MQTQGKMIQEKQKGKQLIYQEQARIVCTTSQPIQGTTSVLQTSKTQISEQQVQNTQVYPKYKSTQGLMLNNKQNQSQNFMSYVQRE